MRASRRSLFLVGNQLLACPRARGFSALRPSPSCRRNLTTTGPRLQGADLQQPTTAPKTGSQMAPAMTTLKGQPLDKAALDRMLRRRMFYTPSFEIYGGVSGLFDYGPPGTSLQSNILDVWRKHFVLEEDMLEVDCSVLTPRAVFKASGHIDRFADWMCKDPQTGEMMRADHFVEDVLQTRLRANKEARGQSTETAKDPKRAKKAKSQKTLAAKLDDAVVQEYEEVLAKIDNFDGAGLAGLIDKYDLRCPSGERPTPPMAFNLMFQTSIGPSSHSPGYLRPETAQGQFLNFAKLLDFNQGVMPFASASIGKSYRNEISPRGGLLRVREFLMAEIEHYVDPESDKKHSRFNEIKDVELEFLTRDIQLGGKTTTIRMPIGTAVRDGIVDNETLGYFLARIQLFLLKIGVDATKMRFRQHLANEMAHYACDCWDAELLTSSGWVECVGCADRSAYDLTVHGGYTGKPLVVRQALEQPRAITSWEFDVNRKLFGPIFKNHSKSIEAAILATSQQERESLARELQARNRIIVDVPDLGPIEIGRELITCELRTSLQHIREYVPNVIEPSFGIGRIFFALCEHNYWVRDGGDETRGVLSFPPTIAPNSVLITPLSNNKSFAPYVARFSQKLRAAQISTRVDDSSASIGKRYSRHDELGTALGVTVDFQTLKDGTITLRDRDSTRQVRADEDAVLAAIRGIVNGEKTWKDIENELPSFTGQEQ